MESSPDNSDTQFTDFSNPNYHMNTDDLSTLDNQLNIGGNIYEDVDTGSGTNSGTGTPKLGSMKRRKKYAHMDLMSMGIDPTKDPVEFKKKPSKLQQSLLAAEEDKNQNSLAVEEDDDGLYSNINVANMKNSFDAIETDLKYEDDIDPYSVSSEPVHSAKAKVTDSFTSYYASLEESLKKRKEEEGALSSDEDHEQEASDNSKTDLNAKLKCINSPDSNDSGIQSDENLQHVHGPLNDDIYAVVSKPEKGSRSPNKENMPEASAEEEILPPGWEKHTDEDGPYYWHVKSGTIQREPPPPLPPGVKVETKRTVAQSNRHSSDSSVPELTSHDQSTAQPLQEFEGLAVKYAAVSLKTIDQLQTSAPIKNLEPGEKPVRFAVRSLGWVQIAEEDLTSEKSSKAVNKCIVDLSLGHNDINDVVGRWGEGKDLFMDLDSKSLRLVDPQEFTTLNSQPIQSIRVWGVGRDNGRDFAYVARDKSTRIHMCHVFRCDTPARHIANTLRDICKKIMMERSTTPPTSQSSASSGNGGHRQRIPASRPTNLPNPLERLGQPNGASFPTPMEEPKKTIRCHYLGTTLVHKPTGTDVLNAAIEKMYAKVPKDKWLFSNVAVAPSTISVYEIGKADVAPVAECRVRFLSFLGISVQNVKLCAFIIHSAADQFVAHIFHCEPSAGALCKTIEAACKLRYQKCLDSHAVTPEIKKQQASKPPPPPPPASAVAKEKLGQLGTQLKQGVQTVFGEFWLHLMIRLYPFLVQNSM